ncbi:ABC transporter ATP-binding protein [Gorillibacterium sp. sgz5001074]|uniref:ABC transporter ATP-binding protein n=1 Tax=Gorillibacterium sp. sgz5001074 TaxID=3446695 RepID=UPI003F66A93D
MEVFKQLKQYYWQDRGFLFGSLLCLITATALGLVYPNLLRYLIDDVITQEQFDKVPALSLLVVGVVTVKGMFQYGSGFLGTRLGNRLAFNLRNALYEKLQYLSFQYYDKARTGDLMSRLTQDLEAIRNFIAFGMIQIINVFVMIVFGAAMMISMNGKLTLVTLITMPFLMVTAFKFEGKIHPAFRNIRKSMSSMTTAAQENITGVRTVKSFAREPHQVEKFSRTSEEYKSSNIFAARLWAAYFPVMELFASLSVVILIAAGGYMVIQDEISIGELVAFSSLIWYIIGPLWGVGFHINNYTQSKTSGERVLDILNEHIHVKDKEKAVELKQDAVKGHVEFDHVTFGYPDQEPALHDFHLNAPPGSVIGLLGGTGSGKSTVIQLLMRAYNVKEGSIRLDGHRIEDLKLDSLRGQIAVVFQETFLFSASIRNNIAYGNKGATMEEIIRAAKLAKAHDFIMELPLGYDTIVGERGLGLSGGQKQRIAIARAFIKNPKILVLDDATSAVDMETEHEIQAGFKELMAGRTTFIIAHRISSLRHADEIVVLDKGRTIQRGTHEQLLKQPGHYRDTFNIQYMDRPDDDELDGNRRAANG